MPMYTLARECVYFSRQGGSSIVNSQAAVIFPCERWQLISPDSTWYLTVGHPLSLQI